MSIDFWEILKNTWSVIMSLWQLWVILLLFGIIGIVFDQLGYELNEWRIRRKFRQGEKWRTGREMIQWLRNMQPDDFEKYIAELFNKLGYVTKVTGGKGDGGIDIVATKDGRDHYIQCKRYSKRNSVGVGAVRDFYGAIADRLTNAKGYFITTNKFTLDGEKFAEDKPIELVDSHQLLEYIRLAGGTNKEVAIAQAVKQCPKCDGQLVERKGKHGKFLGCSNYPKCHHTEKL